MKRAITAKMDTVQSEIEDLFTNLYVKEDFLHLLRKAKAANSDRVLFILRDLAKMLNDVGVICEYGKTIEYYEDMISRLQIPNNSEGMDKRLAYALYEVYADYPSPGEFMQRVVDALDNEFVGGDSLRLRILKRFIKTVNVKENKKYYSKTLAKLDMSEINEAIFDYQKEKISEKNDTDSLIQAANNLASGSFVSPVTTKELLFLFAFAYDMKYYTSADEDGYSVDRDVEKNLFEDYYSDNLTRYIYLEDGGNGGNSDKEPSGYGLNYKNFIDVTFIYYLNREDLEIPEKVSRFYALVNSVKDKWKKKYEYEEARKSRYESIATAAYRGRLGLIIEMNEEDFESYLLENYYCDVRYTYVMKKTGEIREGSKGPFELQFASNAAYEQYSLILDFIREDLSMPGADLSKIDMRVLKDVDDGKSFDSLYTVADKALASRFSELEMNVPSAESNIFVMLPARDKSPEEFLKIIRNIEKRLNPYEALCVTNPEKITRTKMIAAYYHYYCLENGVDDTGDTWKSFKTVYEDISSCLNVYLDDAGYQRISSKNLYDVFVLFFAYCRINNLLEPPASIIDEGLI